MSVIDDILTDTYLLRDLLSIYAGLLKDQKGLHEGNCPDCDRKEKPCKRYYRIVMNMQEAEWRMKKLEEEIRKAG